MSDDSRVDFSALGGSISPETVAAYRKYSESVSSPHPSARRLLGGSAFQLIWSTTLIIIGIVASSLVLSLLADGEWTVGRIVAVCITAALLGGAFIGFALRGIAKRMKVGSPWQARARMAQFAAANGFVYEAVSDPPGLPSSIIVHDNSSRATDRFTFSASPHLEAGNFSRVVVAEGGTQRQDWGYIAIDLGVQLPHIVVRSFRIIRRHPAMSIPGDFLPQQAMRLEGDFGQHFGLFAPEGYGRDALYIFTPDFLALLLDEAREVEIEIIDNWLLIYAPKPLDFASPSTISWVLRIASVVGAKAARQTRLYADDRSDDATVAVEGRRLRSGLGVFSLVVAVVWIAVSIVRVIVIAQ